MAKKTPRHKLYEDAETMFVEHGFKSSAIAEVLSISEVTLSKWRSDHGWDNKRDEFITSPHKLRQLLKTELAKIAKGEKSVIDADSLLKIQKVYAAFEKASQSIPVIISVFKEFDNWMVDNDPEQAVTFTAWHKKYLTHVAQSKVD